MLTRIVCVLTVVVGIKGYRDEKCTVDICTENSLSCTNKGHGIIFIHSVDGAIGRFTMNNVSPACDGRGECYKRSVLEWRADACKHPSSARLIEYSCISGPSFRRLKPQDTLVINTTQNILFYAEWNLCGVTTLFKNSLEVDLTLRLKRIWADTKWQNSKVLEVHVAEAAQRTPRHIAPGDVFAIDRGMHGSLKLNCADLVTNSAIWVVIGYSSDAGMVKTSFVNGRKKITVDGVDLVSVLPCGSSSRTLTVPTTTRSTIYVPSTEAEITQVVENKSGNVKSTNDTMDDTETQGVIIGVAVAVPCLFTGLLITVFCLWGKRKKAEKNRRRDSGCHRDVVYENSGVVSDNSEGAELLTDRLSSQLISSDGTIQPHSLCLGSSAGAATYEEVIADNQTSPTRDDQTYETVDEPIDKSLVIQSESVSEYDKLQRLNVRSSPQHEDSNVMVVPNEIDGDNNDYNTERLNALQAVPHEMKDGYEYAVVMRS